MRGVTERLNTLSRETAFEQREPVAQTSMDEVGDLVQAYNRIQQRTNVHMGQLQKTISQLEDANEQRQQLLESMVELAALVIPVAKGLIVAPLSGYFGAERATHICPNLLEGIARHRAQMVILDLTGVTEASEPLANHLSRATRSAMLMGCEVVLTGAGPDLSWALTQMKTDLDLLTAYRDLEGGLSYAYTRLSTLGLAEQEASP
jgi:rsbT co-antagonist protein RsbR